MVNIKGTSKIKGALDLSDVGLQLSAGDAYTITEEQFNTYGVQMAVKLGFLTHTTSNALKSSNSINITLRSIYDRSITLNDISSEIRPGSTFILPEDRVAALDIQNALAKGMIEIVSSSTPVKPEKTEVELKDPFENLDSEFSEPMSGTEGVSVDPELDTDFLETNEEIEIHNVIDTEKPAPVQENDIDDPKRKTIVWNPNKDPLPHTKTAMDAIGVQNKEEHSPISDSVDVGDISFVDDELDESRIKSHPVLKDQDITSGETNDLNFI